MRVPVDPSHTYVNLIELQIKGGVANHSSLEKEQISVERTFSSEAQMRSDICTVRSCAA